MAEKINFESLQPEFFSNQQTWMEFMEALADVIQEQVRDPIGEIEDIRHIVEGTDPEVIANTIKQLGFDIPFDLIEHNSERLAKSVYMLSLFHEISGTKDFVKGVQFVLGREIEVRNLWTNNYVDFYPEPGGPLLADGGDWYQTTHIDLGMELLPSDKNLVLPEGKTMADRLMDAYFEFAPINHVIRDFYFLLPTEVTIGLAGKIYVDKIDFLTIGRGKETISEVKTLAPKQVTPGETFKVLSDVRFRGDGCFDLDNPVFGYQDAGLVNEIGLLTESFPSKNNQNVTFVVPEGKYGYVAYAKELGRATFTDVDASLEGGWDGATWPEDGSIGDTYGPILFQKEVDGNTREFYLYRTDFPSLGEKTFYVTFENAGRANACDPVRPPITVPPEEPEEPTGPEEPTEPPTDGCVTETLTLLPVYGEHAIGIDTNSEIEFLGGELPNTENQTFVVDASGENYGYFAYPVELGLATFTDVSTGLDGGWDGASWPDDGSIGSVYGPIIVSRAIGDETKDWYLYRTDFPGIGQKTFAVAFENAGLSVTATKTTCADTEEPAGISGYPALIEDEIGIDTAAELDGANAIVADHTGNITISLDLNEIEYGYFAYPIEMGVATFVDRDTGIAGGWDGASWPDDGSAGELNGPIIIQRMIGGQVYDWYLYRTDFPGLGGKVFDVTFENPDLPVNTDIATPPGGSTGIPAPEPEPEPEPEPTASQVVTGYPRFGSAVSVSSAADIEALVNEFADTSNQQFNANVNAGEYGWFAYPAALGKAVFTDPSLGISGSWDGATWPTDGSVGDTYGPIVVRKDDTDWMVYRTDFSSLGDITFEVAFDNPGMAIGDSNDFDTSPYPGGGSTASATFAAASFKPAFVSTANVEEHLVSALPRFGTGNNVDSQVDIESLEKESVIPDNHTITLNIPEGEYGWFAHPAALGQARFIDAAVEIEGGWDGASWPEGDVEMSEGPVLVMMQQNGESVPWLLYRTDFPALGDISFDVWFPNHGLSVGDRHAWDISGYPAPVSSGGAFDTDQTLPVFGTARIGIDTSGEVNDSLTQALPNTRNQSFDINVPTGQYGYFAHPAYMGVARFQEVGGDFAGGWDGAGWPVDGSVGPSRGPLAFHRTIDGKLQTWYLYRTDFPGIGQKSYYVEFGNPVEEEVAGSRVVRVTAQEWSTDRPDIVRISDTGDVTFMPVYRDTVVHITSTFNGNSNTVAITVKAAGAPLDSIKLLAPTIVQGGDIFHVGVEGYYSDGHVRNIDSATIRVLSPYVLRKQGYALDTGNPPEDTVLFVEAKYTDYGGNEHTSVAEVILKHISLNTVVEELQIIGPDFLTENSSERYRAHAFFSDGTEQDVLVLWESSTTSLYIDQEGVATAGKPQANYQATIKATLQFNDAKYVATKQLEIVRSYVTPVSISIQGAERVVELSENKFTAFITWSNGSVTRTQPEWSVDRFSINTDGVLSTGSVGSAISVTVQARTQGLVAQKVVSVYDTPIDIEHITIIGPENLKEGTVGQFRAFAHFNDGRDIEVDPSWSIVTDPGFAQIDSDGKLTFSDPSTGIIEIKAEYDNGVKVYTQTKPIVLVPEVSLISGLTISGDSEVLEGRRAYLQATALYEDGTTEAVMPVWDVRSPDPLNDPEPAADIVSPGIVQGRFVEEDTVVVVTARYFKEIAEFPIIVKNYERPGPDVPLTHRIDGPSIIRASGVGSYSLLCNFDNGCDQEIALSNDWELDVSDDVALIDQNGFLRSVNGQTVDLTVIATWEFAGHVIREEYPVRIVAEESTLGALMIHGPGVLSEQSITPFAVELFRKGQPVVQGTGETPDPIDVEWFVDTKLPYVAINDTGELYIGDLAQGTEIVIRVRLTEGFHVIETTKRLTVGELGPAFGVGPIGLDDSGDIDQYLTGTLSGQEFSVTVPSGEYVYFASPVNMGLVTFTEQGSQLDGGMDGATWPDDGTIGEQLGPLVVSRVSGGVATDWYLYRSDFPGLGSVTYKVTFSNG